MQELDAIIGKLKEVKPELEREYCVREIGVFGTYVRNEHTLTVILIF